MTLVRRENKNKNPVASCLAVIGTTKEMNETNLARHITSNFFNSICQSEKFLIKTVLFAAFHNYM